MAGESSMRYLPREIISNILSRVPEVKKLLELKIVSKEWYTIINSRDFINSHVSRNNGPNSSLEVRRLIFRVCETGWKTKLYCAHLQGTVIPKHQRTPVQGKLRYQCISLELGYRCFQFVGSCNGIVCLRNNGGWGFTLLNPATRTHFSIPALYGEDACSKKVVSWYGFGHDSGTDDYKVVKIIQLESCRTKILVYSWRNKRWNTHELESYHRLSNTRFGDWCRNGTLSNNALHWFAIRDDGLSDEGLNIVAFDLSTEDFRPSVMPLPVTKMHEAIRLIGLNGFLYLTNVKSKHMRSMDPEDKAEFLLAVKKYRRTEEVGSGEYKIGMDIWKMKDYWVRGSWCKLGANIITEFVNNYPRLISLSESRNEIFFHHNSFKNLCTIYNGDLVPGKFKGARSVDISNARYVFDGEYMCGGSYIFDGKYASQHYVESLVKLDDNQKVKIKVGKKRRRSEVL